MYYNAQPHINNNNTVLIMVNIMIKILIFSALQSTRGSHGDCLNILMAKVIYPTDAKKVTMLAVAIEIARMIFHNFSWRFFFSLLFTGKASNGSIPAKLKILYFATMVAGLTKERE